jgi:hypothetical protein
MESGQQLEKPKDVIHPTAMEVEQGRGQSPVQGAAF